MGISETKKKGKGHKKLTNKHVLYYSGVLQEQRAKGGVGIIVTVEGAPEEGILEFYRKRLRELEETRKGNENREMGCMGIYGEPTINSNRIKMIDFYRGNDLIIGNTMLYQQMEKNTLL